MSIYNQFLDFIKAQGVNSNDIFCKNFEDYKIVSFGEQVTENDIYNVSLIIYNDNEIVEIYIRKEIECNNLFELLKQINELNAEYRGISFFIENGTVTLKSLCHTNSSIETVLKQMVLNMQVATEEFNKIN